MASEISESERSFKSAQSGNRSPRRKGATEEPPQSTSTPSQNDASDASSTSSGPQHQTPLARRYNPPESTSGLDPTSYFALQAGSSGIEARSPSYRRPPASRSSHGIETKSGPPPALSTQRSYNSDSPWRRLPSTETAASPSSGPGVSIGSIVKNSSIPSDTSIEPRRFKGMGPNRRSLDATTRSRKNNSLYNDDQDPTISVNKRHGQSSSLELRHERNPEDLFLNLAHASPAHDGASDTLSRIESRKSRAGASGHRSIRPSSSGHPTSSQARFSSQFASMTPESLLSQDASFDNPSTLNSLAALRADLNRERPYAASAHPLDQRKWRQNVRLDTKLPYSSPQQETTTQSVVSGRRRSIHTSYNRYDSSPLHHRPPPSRGEDANPTAGLGDGTESTLSTTAPSTVWDELDDLKARIRKIELTGSLPKTSNAAISTVNRERPATATTIMTTNSISPKHRQKGNPPPEPSTILEGPSPENHPLLDSALAKCKATISPSLYRYLDATVRDAHDLSTMTGGRSGQGPDLTHLKALAVDRQIRRKAENMCRSLTELCLALAEDDPEDDTIRHYHNNGLVSSTHVSGPLNSAGGAIEDADFKASSRVLNRLEARRSSLQNGGNSASSSLPSSPLLEVPSSTGAFSSKIGTLSRANSTTHRHEDDAEGRTGQRPLSRARTDAGSHTTSPQARASRGYTSKHPLPSPPKGSSFEWSPTSDRKTYFPSAGKKSTTPVVSSLGKVDRHRSGDGLTGSGRLAEARQRRLASQGYGSSPSMSPSNMRISQAAAD